MKLASPDLQKGKTCYTDDSLNAIKRFGNDLIKETKNLAVQTKAQVAEALEKKELKLFHQFCILKGMTKLKNTVCTDDKGVPLYLKKPGYTLTKKGDLIITMKSI